ncbi:MAG: glycine zipper 2TM domain-containing protein [Opitutaceae bacterium]|nr:glycine zipper 2TM domain-containing protein [Opitutaceae bacterium]
MKKLLAVLLLGAPALTLSAQVFRPEVVTGAILGGAAGAIIGHNGGRGDAGQGAVIGAAAGAILGGVASEVRRDQAWRNTQLPRGYSYYRGGSGYYGYHGGFSRPIGYGYGYGYRGYRDYGYRDYGYYGYHRDSAVLPGMILGGVAGAIIGNNSGRGDGARGAVIGAIAGGILGAASDGPYHGRVYRPHRRIVRYPVAYEAPVEYAYEPAPAAAPQQVTIINNYYGATAPVAGSAGVNALFGR